MFLCYRNGHKLRAPLQRPKEAPTCKEREGDYKGGREAGLRDGNVGERAECSEMGGNEQGRVEKGHKGGE